jgi:hypothetical protein
VTWLRIAFLKRLLDKTAALLRAQTMNAHASKDMMRKTIVSLVQQAILPLLVWHLARLVRQVNTALLQQVYVLCVQMGNSQVLLRLPTVLIVALVDILVLWRKVHVFLRYLVAMPVYGMMNMVTLKQAIG